MIFKHEPFCFIFIGLNIKGLYRIEHQGLRKVLNSLLQNNAFYMMGHEIIDCLPGPLFRCPKSETVCLIILVNPDSCMPILPAAYSIYLNA